MSLVAALAGYLIGSLPTAQGLASLWGVDLLHDGSGNPGANNARRLGGFGLAGLVLGVEAAKGAAAVLIGIALAGDVGAVTAGIGAVAGNVFNVWYRFKGGKGLGISAGIILSSWPPAFAVSLAVIVLAVVVTRSSGMAALATISGLVVMGFGWNLYDWANGWGISRTDLLLWLAVGIAALLWRKHFRDWSVKRLDRRSLRESV